MSPPAAGRIEIRSLRVVATHGALLEERERPQPFELDIDLELDTGPAAHSDRLEDTVDYGAAAVRAAELVRSTSFLLLEALAAALAAAMVGLDERVLAAHVTVRKLRPPIQEDIASVGVRVTRRRAEPSR